MTTETQQHSTQQIQTAEPAGTVFSNLPSFVSAQRMAAALVESTLVPPGFQGRANLPNAMIALEMAQRMGASPLAVMQNIHIIHKRPSWASTFVAAAINSSGKFSPLRFKLSGIAGEDERTCIAWAIDSTGEKLEGPPVSIGMAKKEGWYGKNGSKWQTMPELMLRYRAITFFGRIYAPEILMGMKTQDEMADIGAAEPENLSEPIQVQRAQDMAEQLMAEYGDAPASTIGSVQQKSTGFVEHLLNEADLADRREASPNNPEAGKEEGDSHF